MEKVIEVKEIGPVTFRRKNTCKNLKITVKHYNVVNVTLPPFFSMESAMLFVLKKKEWIKKQQLKISSHIKAPVIFEEATVFKTNWHSLNMQKHQRNTIKTVIDSNYINIFYPHIADVKDPRIQSAVKNAILRTWRLEAEAILPDLVENLASRYSFKYGRVSIRNNKTRWGSCSGKSNNINLNLHLIRLPRHLCEYVILHELAHTVHRNHREPFWKLLDMISGNAKGLDKELNSRRILVW